MKWGVDASTSEGVARAVTGIFKTGALTSVSDTKRDFFASLKKKLLEKLFPGFFRETLLRCECVYILIVYETSSTKATADKSNQNSCNASAAAVAVELIGAAQTG